MALLVAFLVAAYAAKGEETREEHPEGARCHFCGRSCGSLSRFSFIHTGGD
jgi:hypothetical protein